MQVAKAVESEWFKKDSGSTRYFANRDNFHRLRLYARGEQSIQKYKDELSINGDLSYLNLDWKPVPIIPKFVDIVVNGIQERTYDLKAFSVDPVAAKKRTEFVNDMLNDMYARQFAAQLEAALRQREAEVHAYYQQASQAQQSLLAKQAETVEIKEREANEL